ncbi:hypothetical protein, partial [Vibrio cholerae]|uniref:hypothetical protein n=1 Tax=Vibrio cholerae TaxID=666 RepID=UPI00112518D4
IRSFLIDPLGLIEGLKLPIGKQADHAVPGFRGGQFHRTKHFLPEMIEKLWAGHLTIQPEGVSGCCLNNL